MATHTSQLTRAIALTLDLVILAAGRSMRFGAPKALEPIGPAGKHLTDYAIFDAVRAGFSRVVFVIRREHEAAFRDHQATAFPPSLDVEYVFQEMPISPCGTSARAAREKPWGTGHALLCAAHAVNRPFAMINADDFYGRSAFERLAQNLRASEGRHPPHFAMVSYCLGDTLSGAGGVSRAVCDVDTKSHLQNLREYLELQMVDGAIVGRSAESQERRTFSGDAPVSMNIWGFTPDVFPIIDRAFNRFLHYPGPGTETEFFVGMAAQQVIESGAAAIEVLPGGSGWMGMTYPGDRKPVDRALAEMVRDGEYPSQLLIA